MVDLTIAPEILGIGVIVVIGGGLAAVWYLRRKGYWEARRAHRRETSDTSSPPS